MKNLSDMHILIIDIGKTHVKLHVLDNDLKSVYARQMSNTVDFTSHYPCAKVSDIWLWLCETIQTMSSDYNIKKLTITTHGATAALIDRNATQGNGLVLPVLDYEHVAIFDDVPEYEQIRPDFIDSYSPSLPAGLNLGRQLYWLKKKFPLEFAKATDVLMYPQYWAWRFTGTRVSEITSLGCHTDLWSVKDNCYSKLVDTLGCEQLFPPMQAAWFNCSTVDSSLCQQLGIDEDCQVYSGLHDSNASFLRYRLSQEDRPFTVISTGTWTILMASQVPLKRLDASADMLANIDALSTPIACARFMGGREFEAICEQAGSWLGEQFDESDLQSIIDKQVFAIPDFSDGSGPFGGKKSSILGPVDKVSGIALATLYSALMIDYQLNKLGAQGDIIIEGAFLKNPLLCAVLNQLRSKQSVKLSQDSTGTVVGAAYLTDWGNTDVQIELEKADMASLSGLSDYRTQWLHIVS